MEAPERAGLYAELDCLRTATPLAICDFVLAVDGHTGIAHELAHEFRALGQLGSWKMRVSHDDIVFTEPDLGALRNFYVMQCKASLGASATRRALANRLTSVLTTFAAADAAEDVPHLCFVSSQKHRARWQSAARHLIGDAVCLDTTHNAEVEATFAGVAVDYVANAGSSPEIYTFSAANVPTT
jgi:hypothetical protein